MRVPITRDIHLLIAALFLAIVIWFVAGADIKKSQGDMVEKIIIAGLEVRGVAPNLVVTATPKDVEVRVRGPRQLVEPLDGSKVRAYVSVAGRGEGEHGVRVQAFVPEGVQVVDMMPASTSVTVDTVIGRDLPVAIALIGFPDRGCVPLEPESTPRSATVAGPKTRIEAVKSVLAQIDISGITAEVSRDIAVVPVDAGGRPVEGVSVYPASVRVTVPVEARPEPDLPPVETGQQALPQHDVSRGVTPLSQ